MMPLCNTKADSNTQITPCIICEAWSESAQSNSQSLQLPWRNKLLAFGSGAGQGAGQQVIEQITAGAD